MGRKVKRVALDFDWPAGKVWAGYINEHYRQCLACRGSGTTTARKYLDHLAHLLMMTGPQSASSRPLHPWLCGIVERDERPSSDALELTTGLADRAPERLFGHDSIDRWVAANKIIAAAGLDPKTWGLCPVCYGEGADPSCKEAYDAWTPTNPPAGEGWQMWETVSEGSPISPVCKTPEELARWLADNKASAFGRETATYDEWLAMIRAGWAPTAVGGGGMGLVSGVAAVANLKGE